MIAAKKMSSASIQAEIHKFLSQRRLAVVSSNSADGSPQSALVGIAIGPSLEIVFDTLNTSRKYANLVGNPSCSLVIGWEGEQTVQFEGVASRPAGTELDRYREIYFGTWPEGRTHLSWPAIAYFVVRPTWIRFSDYDCDPPLIQEFKIGGEDGVP